MLDVAEKIKVTTTTTCTWNLTQPTLHTDAALNGTQIATKRLKGDEHGDPDGQQLRHVDERPECYGSGGTRDEGVVREVVVDEQGRY